ncbi:rolling circle replication-associated protein [Cerasicoccus frondis]|uniref:rolling circle replication-associated protein n=1 Tax=Cerasicoccus frondis TaxID=490090 RepID=UPI003CCD8F2B
MLRDRITKPYLEVKPYNAPNWYTRHGVMLKRQAIEKKGLPPWKQCLFITLTTFHCGKSAAMMYVLGKERLRRFLAKLRSVIGPFPWAWKLEFHDDGYAHWHLIVHYKKRIPRDCLAWVGQWWGLGRTNVERLRRKKFVYLFKYVTKGAFEGDNTEGLNLPDWLLDFNGGSRMRFWQTGGGFYTKAQDPDWSVDEKEPPQDKRYSYIRRTIREQWRFWMRRAVVCVRSRLKHYPIKAGYFVLNTDYNEFYQRAVNLSIHGKAALSGFSFNMTPSHIKESIESWQSQKISNLASILNLTMV